ncbi:MAG: F0F1 ATP synthase subunit A, partial [Oscillospiraceae bacterium]|nr:F0F1 ATP synthase subunit A [Oscillospiraceae bacterium]
MDKVTLSNLILLLIFASVSAVGILWRRSVTRRIGEDGPTKGQKRLKTLATAVVVFGVYLVTTRAIILIFGPHESEPIAFSIWADRVKGAEFISYTMVYTWAVMAVILAAALALRFTVLRKLKNAPSGAQNVLETIAEALLKYTNSQAHGIGEVLGSYLFTVAAFLVGCACVELFGLRTPASDITMTLVLGLITYFLINWYGIRKKGVVGRVKAMAPNPFVFIIKVVADLAIPV